MPIIRANSRSIAPAQSLGIVISMGQSQASTRMKPPETIEVDKDRVGCDGGKGALGHPLVYLTMDNSGKVDCPYCGRRYIRRYGTKADDTH